MFYNFDEIKNEWLCGTVVRLATGEILTEDNKLEIQGWKWYDIPPEEYLKTLEIKE